MIFDKSKKELYDMLPEFQKMEINLEETETKESYELPIVVFAVGGNGRGLLIEIINIDKIGHGISDMVDEEFLENDTEWSLKPGIYKAELDWLTIKDPYHGDYDCELVVNNLKTIFDYEEYKKSKNE